MDENSLGARIAALRAAHRLTAEQLGRAIGLTETQMSEVEDGTRKLEAFAK
jgi:transcriptional regulator with XRE-family HTH domain